MWAVITYYYLGTHVNLTNQVAVFNRAPAKARAIGAGVTTCNNYYMYIHDIVVCSLA